jgi:hypothetical protein
MSVSSFESNKTNTSSDSNNSECFICNEERSEPAMSLLDYEIERQCQCRARLHARCYSRWLTISKSCPICRIPIINEEERDNTRFFINPHQELTRRVDILPNYGEIIYHNRNENNNWISIIVVIIICSFLIIIISAVWILLKK